MKQSAWLIPTILLIIPTFVFAKGGFDYITVKGPGITGEITITDPALTADFFAFADFSKGAIETPADPGQGYQIVRVYVVENKDQPFDQLHYYPYTGYVYYDGLIAGASEYDGEWYAAIPAVGEPFQSALAQRARLTWLSLGMLLLLLAVFWFAYRSAEKKT
jgi:hypothetical protein